MNVNRTSLRGARLVSSSDKEFIDLLTSKAPGLQNTLQESALLPETMAFVNDSLLNVAAYQVQWTVTGIDGKNLIEYAEYSEPHVLISHEGGAGLSLSPARLRLLHRKFNTSEVELSDLEKAIRKTPATFNSSPAKVTAVELDGVIFDDGTFVGSDRSNFSLRFQASSNALHDEGVSVLLGAEEGLADSALLERLEAQAAKINDYPLETMHDFYYRKRSIVAGQWIGLYKHAGRRALIATAKQFQSEPRYHIKKTSQ